MNSLVVNIFFVLLHLRALVNAVETDCGIGVSACMYLGDVDNENIVCHKDAVKLHYIPETCTSYFYDGATCNDKFEIKVKSEDTLKSLIATSKGVFLFYGQSDITGWYTSLDPAKTVTEIPKVKELVTTYAVKGLVLKELCYNFKARELPPPVPTDFYTNLQAYVRSLKETIPNVKIGMEVNALNMLPSYINSTADNPAVWPDFCLLNDVMDYYIIAFDNLNKCIVDLLKGGIAPMDDPHPYLYTLNYWLNDLKRSSIAKDKMYFKILINPKLDSDQRDDYLPCELSYNEYCENPESYKPQWCCDNSETFYEKGVFAKKHSKGFVAMYIDLIDRDLKFKCDGDKYITFNMLLNGFNAAPKLICKKIDEINTGK